MNLTTEEQVLDIEKMLDRIENILVSRELPTNLAGCLIGQSLHEAHDRLSEKLKNILSCVQGGE